jgi:hypothetical protein
MTKVKEPLKVYVVSLIALTSVYDADEQTDDQLGGHTAKLLTGYDVEHVAEQALNIAHALWKPGEGYFGHSAVIVRVTGNILKLLIDASNSGRLDLSDEEEQAAFDLTSEGPKRDESNN